jgi:hypothetical protein
MLAAENAVPPLFPSAAAFKRGPIARRVFQYRFGRRRLLFTRHVQH